MLAVILNSSILSKRVQNVWKRHKSKVKPYLHKTLIKERSEAMKLWQSNLHRCIYYFVWIYLEEAKEHLCLLASSNQ